MLHPTSPPKGYWQDRTSGRFGRRSSHGPPPYSSVPGRQAATAFNRHRLMHAVGPVRQSCTTMGCGDRGAGMAREGREQRQAEIYPLAPTNTTRTHRLAMLRSVRGTHLAE